MPHSRSRHHSLLHIFQYQEVKEKKVQEFVKRNNKNIYINTFKMITPGKEAFQCHVKI